MTSILKRLGAMGDHCRTRDGEDDRSDRISPTNASHRLVEKDFGFGELTAKLRV
jgi:DNA-binding MarR family transcriptional regulator